MVNDLQNDYSCAASGNQIDVSMMFMDQSPFPKVFCGWRVPARQGHPYFPDMDKKRDLRTKTCHYVDNNCLFQG